MVNYLHFSHKCSAAIFYYLASPNPFCLPGRKRGTKTKEALQRKEAFKDPLPLTSVFTSLPQATHHHHHRNWSQTEGNEG